MRYDARRNLETVQKAKKKKAQYAASICIAGIPLSPSLIGQGRRATRLTRCITIPVGNAPESGLLVG